MWFVIEAMPFLFYRRSQTIVKFSINCALSTRLNPYKRHSDCHKLKVYATKMHKLEVCGTKMHKLKVYATKMHKLEVCGTKMHKLKVYATKMHKLEVCGTKMHKLEVCGTYVSIYF